ncbi:MFS transporter [Streptomyces sp. 1222.5]|uniref:MFS transporter n=1 Tax=Streptomyces sp. 1222.5 TaxID=1881026 RepID=UPI003EBCA9B6
MLRTETAFSTRERISLLGFGLALFVVQVDGYALSVSLPTISRAFSQKVTDLHWLITGFMLAFGALLTVTGRIADHIGPRRATVLGLTAFALASAVCGTAQEPVWLIVGRILQGSAAALLVPSAIAAVSAAFSGKARGRALGIVLGSAATGSAVGPVVGGMLAQSVGWRAIFYVNIPITLAVTAIISRFSRESETVSNPAQPFPVVGPTMLTIGTALITVTLDRGSSWGWTSAITLTCGAVGILMLCVFIFSEHRGRRPLYGPDFYHNAPFLRIVFVASARNIAIALIALLSALYLQYIILLTPGRNGIIFLAFSVSVVASNYISGILGELGKNHIFTLAAIALNAVGVYLLTVANSIPVFAIFLSVCGVGVGISGVLANVITQNSVPEGKGGSAYSFSLSIRVLLTAVAISAVSTALENLSGGTAHAHPSPAAIKTVLRITAILLLIGALALVPDAFHSRAARKSRCKCDPQ